MSITNKVYHRCLVLLSGGTGTRIGGDVPKQYIEVGGRMIIEHTLRSMCAWRDMDSIAIVAGDEWRVPLQDICNKLSEECISGPKADGISFLGFASPGENRQLSILNALQQINGYMADDAWIMIHDAARPAVSAELIDRLDKAGAEAGVEGVMPYLPMKDTVYESIDGIHISRNLNRGEIYAGQTPEYYAYRKYLAAVEALSAAEIRQIHGTTEPAVTAGMNVVMVPGDESNYKITTPEDLERFIQMNATE